MQELINNPPTAGHDGADDRFNGRDWRGIGVGELVQESDLRWVELDSGVEEATNVSEILLLARRDSTKLNGCRVYHTSESRTSIRVTSGSFH